MGAIQRMFRERERGGERAREREREREWEGGEGRKGRKETYEIKVRKGIGSRYGTCMYVCVVYVCV